MSSSVQEFNNWQWLEVQQAPECLEWVDAQNERTNTLFDRISTTKYLEARLQELGTNESRNPNFWLVGHLYRITKSNENKQGILERAMRRPDGSLQPWQKIIDIDALGRAEEQSYELQVIDMPSYILEDRLVLPLSVGGSDTIVLREVNMTTGEIVKDGFRTDEGRISFSWMDTNHLLISHCLDNGATTTAGWPRDVYLWVRGTELRDARCVWTADSSDTLCFVKSIVAQDHRRGLIIRVKDFSTFTYHLVSLDGSIDTLPLPEKQPMQFPPATTASHIVGTLLESKEINGVQAPAGAIIACSISDGLLFTQRLSIVYIPEDGEINAHLMQDGIKASRSRLHVTLTKRGKERCISFERRHGAWIVVNDEQIGNGAHQVVVSSDPYSNDVVVEKSGLVSPKRIWLVSVDKSIHHLHQQVSAFPENDYIVDQGAAPSNGGTEIDYLTLRPKSAKQPVRVLMTGYEAFGTSFPTMYLDSLHGGISLVPWLESGGAFVIPFIRGGGERGEDWHQAARQEKRQNSYDDFIAVAEDLVRSGLTAAGKIGVFGTSNGGLLAAVVGTQRPDLFRAIVSDAPLTDMLRYHKIAMGAAWIYEFGDPEDPKTAKVLRSYSPYHNVQEDTEYPAFLVTISTRDDRVGAGHARKFVARLQEAGVVDAFLLEDKEGGHLVSDSFKNARLMSRRVAYFMHYL